MIFTKNVILVLLFLSAFPVESSLLTRTLTDSLHHEGRTKLNVTNSTTPTTPYPADESEGLLADERLPEDVDFSEGGWATDFAASIAGLLFLVSAILFYPHEQKHFGYMHLGTFLAHLSGGFAHRHFPNRASDGVGHRGFYVSMMLGYSGNCLRYGVGWGLDRKFAYIAAANVLFLVATGFHVIYKMEHTTNLIDHADGMNHRPDLFFGAGEAFCSVMEVVASIYFLVKRVGFRVSCETVLFYVAVGANVVGWAAVYLFGFLYLAFGLDYDPSLMQRIFHFAMIIMLWSIDAAVRKVSSVIQHPRKEQPHEESDPDDTEMDSESQQLHCAEYPPFEHGPSPARVGKFERPSLSRSGRATVFRKVDIV